ncbi:MAG: M15 family metallopeptidase, partial [Pseudomonadota bacterium]
RMLEPALESLRSVFAAIEAADPDLYARINTAGALCVRHIRGAPGRTSTHAFGLSVDLNIDGQLDQLGDGKTQLGLTILADFFRAEGWYWGAGFSREDSMHFEVSRDLVEQWIAEGKL